MLHDNQRIAKIPEILQRCEQFVVVPLMQTDTWLVQNIADSDQSGANLCCKTDSLRLAAGQCSRRSGKGKIIQSDVDQESNSCPDFL